MPPETPTRTPLPERFCNLERLLNAMVARRIDGVVASTMYNVFYLSGLNAIAHKSDEPRPYAVILSRHAPEHPILVVAEYYLSTFLTQPTWVEDIRPFRAVMLPLDLPPDPTDIDRFITRAGTDINWVQHARELYGANITEVCRGGCRELGLTKGRIAFDDLRFGYQLALPEVEIVDGYDAFMFAREVKTPDEIRLLKEAARVNQSAIEATVASWERGMSWRQLNQAYHEAAVSLGGFVRDPGAMVFAHPRGVDPAVTLQTGLEDFEIERGLHVMFDCHGTRSLYCWDGGKTWIVDDEPRGETETIARATAEVMQVILDAMRPGTRISELQAKGRDVYRRFGLPHSETALIFFHGLGLSHMDMQQVTADGTPNSDWAMEEGMVVPVHLLYPGGERERMWHEEVALVTNGAAQSLFTWGFEPITGS